MPKAKTAVTQPIPASHNHEVLAADLTASTEVSINALAVAKQLDYEGSLTVGALEDEIRFYQRRSVEACVELGKRLLILRELTPHGEFAQRIELLGISARLGQQFMSATLKFSNAKSTSLLAAAGTQTKMLELLVLDDGEIAELSKGGTVRGLDMDAIETMSVRELRAALRDAKEGLAAKEHLIADKNAKIDKLSIKKKHHADPWPDEVAGLKDDVHGLSLILDEGLGKMLTIIDAAEQGIDQQEADSDSYNGYKTVIHHIDEAVERLVTLVASLRSQHDARLAGHIALDKTNTID